ncbi:MAG TPA: xanthine dehydrogenase family protein molybdopterin-binding subunit [Thermoanaerobaculia bacterium]|jgi:carbon-monoxide dehydrogenase large subunit|nr:xanthine dehydrogenase family protein molybdopterin-binding subunit [Thermoanaerobaculia bacterium]
MASRILGSGIKRREDPRLVTGQAKYTDDIVLPGMVYMSVVRSPYGHARIKRIDTKKAAAMPGVLGVYTGQQLKEAGFGPIPCAWVVPGSDTKTPPYPPVAIDIVRYTGNAVAFVVAHGRSQARDAADAVDVSYEPLPVVVDGFKATQPKAPQLHDGVPNNVCFHWHVTGGDVDAAFKSAEVIVKDHIINQRLIPNAMEPRGAVAQYLGATGEITLWSTTQNPHIARFLISLDTGIPEQKIRVIAPEVGGGFGSKIPHYPEDSMAIFASKILNRPVKWTESRSENYRATIHGRDHIQDVELAAMKDGTIVGLRAKVWANLGAYLSTASTGIPTILHGLMLSGVYKIPNIHEDVYGVFTNTTPVDAYRGAGRPEATFMVERMIDLLAHELKMDPVAVRRKNMIPPFTDGYQVATGLTYDTGNYEGALAKALEMAGYEKLRKQQAEMRAKGQYLGIGLCTYAEICGLGPSQVAGAVGFGGGLWESAIVRFHPSGKVNVMVGISPHGQGEETTFAQIVASELGVGVDDVEITHGDTEKTPMGWGTYGSRGTAVGSGALMGALKKIKDKAKTLTAHLLEASVDDIDYADGKFFVKGSPGKSKSIQDVALMANVAWNMPAGLEPGLEASSFFDPPNFVYPFGAHIAVVKVDAETGEISLERYIAVDDCGKVINPMIVAGQIHGGIAQGLGQALWEGAVYDDDGQLLSGSMMDYAVPKAAFFPKFELAMTETLTKVNPLGVKGIGETGTIASTPALYNAVADALAPLGVKTINMPLTPERVWRAIREARS